VLIGLPGRFSTALAGEAGGRHLLELVKRGVLTVMAQLGCPTIADIGPAVVRGMARTVIRQATYEVA
jgi:isopentenyl diphosphate isomerase/L-lactate dehydrogenase-like FMN-dependent dehydrogenase